MESLTDAASGEDESEDALLALMRKEGERSSASAFEKATARRLLVEALRKCPGKFQDVVSAYKEWLREVEIGFTEFVSTIPIQYRQLLDEKRLRNPGAARKALSAAKFYIPEDEGYFPIVWEKKEKGLVLFGQTGGGKTRVAYELLRRMRLLAVVDVRALSATAFAREVRNCGPNGTNQLNQVVDDLVRPEVLLIDDLHQAKFTARYAECLYDVIEQRTSEDKPIIVTCQLIGKELVAKLCHDNPEAEDTAQAIRRRLCDYCDAIDFDAKVEDI